LGKFKSNSLLCFCCEFVLKELTDTLTDPTVVKQIHDVALTVDGVDNCSNIRTRKMGHYTNIDLTIHVDPLLVYKNCFLLFIFKECFPWSSNKRQSGTCN
jgi:hypothetical protein